MRSFRGARASRLEGFRGRFIGIDISPMAVDHCKGLALPSNFEFRVDNANELDTIDDESVDYAFGDGVLHHLDLERAAPALARKLGPDGYARFIEPAQGNFLLRAFRMLTPKLRTPDEHPFDQESIAVLERHFQVSVNHHGLLRHSHRCSFSTARRSPTSRGGGKRGCCGIRFCSRRRGCCRSNCVDAETPGPLQGPGIVFSGSD